MLQRMLGTQKRSANVHCKMLIERVDLDITRVAGRARHTRATHNRVETAHTIDRLRQGPLHRRSIGDVDRHELRLPPGRAYQLVCRQAALMGNFPPAGDHDRGALLREPKGGRPSNPRRPAGNKGDLVRQHAHMVPIPLTTPLFAADTVLGNRRPVAPGPSAVSRR